MEKFQTNSRVCQTISNPKCSNFSFEDTAAHSKNTSTCVYTNFPNTERNMNSFTTNCEQICSNNIFSRPPLPESRVQYVPYERKQIIMDQVQRIICVPHEKTIIEYEQVKYTTKVPVQRLVTDYYAIQTQVQYIPQVIEETRLEYVPVEKHYQRLEYYPVQRKIVHLPDKQNNFSTQYQTNCYENCFGSQTKCYDQNICTVSNGANQKVCSEPINYTQMGSNALGNNNFLESRNLY